jgi:hypothetical protein
MCRIEHDNQLTGRLNRVESDVRVRWQRRELPRTSQPQGVLAVRRPSARLARLMGTVLR